MLHALGNVDIAGSEKGLVLPFPHAPTVKVPRNSDIGGYANEYFGQSKEANSSPIMDAPGNRSKPSIIS